MFQRSLPSVFIPASINDWLTLGQRLFNCPFNREIIQLEFSLTWSCVSLTRATTSSEWKLFTFDKMEVNSCIFKSCRLMFKFIVCKVICNVIKTYIIGISGFKKGRSNFAAEPNEPPRKPCNCEKCLFGRRRTLGSCRQRQVPLLVWRVHTALTLTNDHPIDSPVPSLRKPLHSIPHLSSSVRVFFPADVVTARIDYRAVGAGIRSSAVAAGDSIIRRASVTNDSVIIHGGGGGGTCVWRDVL